jgi:hypothetical protein
VLSMHLDLISLDASMYEVMTTSLAVELKESNGTKQAITGVDLNR